MTKNEKYHKRVLCVKQRGRDMVNYAEFNEAVITISKEMALNKIASTGIDIPKQALKYVILRNGRTDDEIDEMMRKYKVVLSMTYMNYLGKDYAQHILYKVAETQEQYDAAIQEGKDFVTMFVQPPK